MQLPSLGLVVALVAACAPGAGTIADDDDDDNGVPGSDGGPDDIHRPDAAVCEETAPIQVNETPPPDLLLVVDKSGSMADSLGTGDQKWPVMRDALLGVVDAYAGGIYFGLMLYPFGDSCAPGLVSAAIEPDNRDNIQLQLALTFPAGGTPTDVTLGAALTYYATLPANPGGQYVLLATDGQPNCGDPSDTLAPTITESIAAVEALSGAGIKTYVLGFDSGENVDPATLQALAVAGDTGMYYLAASPAELDAALEAIAGEVVVPPCTFTLSSTPPDPSLLTVSFDGTAVPRSLSHSDGWDYDPSTNSITFYGSACQQLQSGSVANVHVDYGCAGPVIP